MIREVQIRIIGAWLTTEARYLAGRFVGSGT
jgi:hypothetical protein